MKVEEIVTARAVNLHQDALHGARPHHIGHVDILPCANSERTYTHANKHTIRANKRYKIFLNILQKVNMCFLVLFIVYFVWTVSTSHGHSYSGAIDSAWNYSRITNATGQVSYTT